MFHETTIEGLTGQDGPYVSLYSRLENARLVMLETVFIAAVTATMSCHVGSQPWPWGRSSVQRVSATVLPVWSPRRLTSRDNFETRHSGRCWMGVRSNLQVQNRIDTDLGVQDLWHHCRF